PSGQRPTAASSGQPASPAPPAALPLAQPSTAPPPARPAGAPPATAPAGPATPQPGVGAPVPPPAGAAPGPGPPIPGASVLPPVGAYSVILSGDEGALPTSATPTATATYNPLAPTGAGTLIRIPSRLGHLPPGTITVTGEPYGVLRIPTRRIVQLQMDPVNGT